jgi:hypothetical protein
LRLPRNLIACRPELASWGLRALIKDVLFDRLHLCDLARHLRLPGGKLGDTVGYLLKWQRD